VKTSNLTRNSHVLPTKFFPTPALLRLHLELKLTWKKIGRNFTHICKKKKRRRRRRRRRKKERKKTKTQASVYTHIGVKHYHSLK
jgi:hypothetical protein